MTLHPLRDRRDAEELDAALDGAATSQVERRHADLLRTVAVLRAHEPAGPRPEFAADLRERLMAAAANELVAAAPAVRREVTSSPVPSAGRRRLGTVVASLVIVGGTAGMAAAAQGALPGDPLYPVKRGGEEVLAALAPGAAGSGDLSQAAQRLDEAEQLQARGADDVLVVGTLDEVADEARRGSERAFAAYAERGGDAEARRGVDGVRDLADVAVPRLAALAEADPALAPVAGETAGLLRSLDEQARSACPSCSGAPAVALPTLLTDATGQAGAAATLDSLLSAPAEQASLDAGALADLDADQVRGLVAAAEQQARAAAPLPGAEEWPVLEPSARGPVASSLVSAGEQTSGTVRGATGAVDDLVGGLRDGAGQVTGRLPSDGALGTVTSPLTDTVDQALEGVSGVTGSLAGRPRG